MEQDLEEQPLVQDGLGGRRLEAQHQSGKNPLVRGVVDCRGDFPIFSHHPALTYLDSAATSHKPAAVLHAMRDFSERTNANVHRGAYPLADEASRAFEDARRAVASFIGAPSPSQIVFTKNATEALNVAAFGLSETRLRAGDEVVISLAEHHSNLLPWQHYCAQRGATLRAIAVSREGQIDRRAFSQALGPRTKVVALTHCSNVLGALLPIQELSAEAHLCGAVVVVDGAQSVAHVPVDVSVLGADVLTLSGHKLCGPTGIGVLYARTELLESWPPLMFGGGMVDAVDIERSTFALPPHRFESGTPPIAEAVGLAAAIRYLSQIGMEAIAEHVEQLRSSACAELQTIPGVEIIGPTARTSEAGILSFAISDIHPHDLAWQCGTRGVCIRAGSHCAHPLLKSLGYAGCARASFYLYNTKADVDSLLEAVGSAVRVLKR